MPKYGHWAYGFWLITQSCRRQTSSADNMARQQFQGFNICTDFLMQSTLATTRQ